MENSEVQVTTVERIFEKLMVMSCSSDHLLIDDKGYTYTFPGRNRFVRRLAEALDTFVSDIRSNAIDFVNVEQMFGHLEAYHELAYSIAKNFPKNDIALGKKTRASNKVEDECWRTTKYSLKRSDRKTMEHFAELINLRQIKRREKEEAYYNGSIHSMIGGLPELGKKR